MLASDAVVSRVVCFIRGLFLSVATPRTERGIRCNSAPATGTRIENRFSQHEVEHEANAVRNQHRERCPGNRRHTAPRRVPINIAGQKKVSSSQDTAHQTNQSREAVRPILPEDSEEEKHEGETGHDFGWDWNETESAAPVHTESSPRSLLPKSGNNASSRDGSNQNVTNTVCHTLPGRFHSPASHATGRHKIADPVNVRNIATAVPIRRRFASASADLSSSARLRTKFSTRSAAAGSSSIANPSSARTARAERSAYRRHGTHSPRCSSSQR